MTDLLAWRASDEFAAALRARMSEKSEFFDDVLGPWTKAHPGHEPFGSNGNATTFDQRVDGFADADRKVDPPAGLSRAQRRDYLKPVRGPAGDRWREVLRELNACPSIDAVFKQFGVPVFALVGHRLCRFNLHLWDEVWLTATADIPSTVVNGVEHVTAAKTSEFYAAKEAREAAGSRP